MTKKIKLHKHHKIHISYVLVIIVLIILGGIFISDNPKAEIITERFFYKEIQDTENTQENSPIIEDKAYLLEKDCNLGYNLTCYDYEIKKEYIKIWASHEFDFKANVTISAQNCLNEYTAIMLEKGTTATFYLNECEIELENENNFLEIPLIIKYTTENGEINTEKGRIEIVI